MGILNVTPDSFSDGGEFFDPEHAVAQGLKLVEDGADVLDVGGESTRPNSTPVDEDEELRRVVPVLQSLRRQTKVPLSIDTTKANVARAALEAGAQIVNDISGLMFDPAMPKVCLDFQAGVVAMHIQGTPQTMQINPQYDDVVAEVSIWLQARVHSLLDFGIPPEKLCLDPGIGFGKTPEHNMQLLSNVAALKSLGFPVLIGHSRKRFIGKMLGRKVDETLAGTVGIAIALARQNVDMIRVHDVRAVRDALLAWNAVNSRVPHDERSFERGLSFQV